MREWTVVYIEYIDEPDPYAGYYIVNAPMGIPDDSDPLVGPFNTKQEAEEAGKDLDIRCNQNIFPILPDKWVGGK